MNVWPSIVATSSASGASLPWWGIALISLASAAFGSAIGGLLSWRFEVHRENRLANVASLIVRSALARAGALLAEAESVPRSHFLQTAQACVADWDSYKHALARPLGTEGYLAVERSFSFLMHLANTGDLDSSHITGVRSYLADAFAVIGARFPTAQPESPFDEPNPTEAG